MENEVEGFSEGYNPNKEVEQILSGQQEISSEDSKEFEETIEVTNAELLARRSVSEFISNQYHRENSSELDKDILKTLYNENENRIKMAENFQRFCGAVRDHEKFGSKLDTEKEVEGQKAAITTELNIINASALDPRTKEILEDAIKHLGGQVEE